MVLLTITLSIMGDLFEKTSFAHDVLEIIMREYAHTHDIKLGVLAQPLRVALTHRTTSPSLFELMEILGKNETLKRLDLYLNA